MSLDHIVEEFRTAYLAGERPDVAEIISRAPEADRDELGRRIRMVLAEEPPPDPAPETLVMAQAILRGEQPLIALRGSKGLTRDAVVHQLRESLGVPPDKEPRVAEYYHDLETGQLPLAGIRDRVFDALASALGVARSALMLKGPGPSDREVGVAVFARQASPDDLFDQPIPLMSPPEEPDEVDDLFTGGPR
ncbi:MAG: hypothetical protein O2976_05475 [Actinomycetota bacterium]|nr:hypothetical protein [Actinomycetota bacterium]